MSNILIARPLWTEAAQVQSIPILDVGSELDEAKAKKLLDEQPSEVWRTDSADAAALTPHVEIDAGSAVSWDTVALLFTNATATATWRVRTAGSQANLTASPTFDSGAVTLHAGTDTSGITRFHAFLTRDTPQSDRFARIDISDSSNSDGFFEAGVFFMGTRWQPSKNYDFGAAEFTPIAEAEFSRTIENATVPRRKPVIPSTEFSLSFLDETEIRENAYPILRERGSSRPVLVVLDPDNTNTYRLQEMFYGLITNSGSIIHSAFQIYEVSFRVEEMI